MYVSAAQIRKALIDIAKEKGRPEFEVCVIRTVIFSIHNNLPHDLKRLVLDRIEAEVNDRIQLHDSEQTVRLKKLRSICKNELIKVNLSKSCGLDLRQINHMVRGRYEINDSLWSKIEPFLSQYDS